jgi:hypothetical protein
MSIKVNVKPQKATISSVTVARTANLALQQLNNVETQGAQDGYVLTYEAGSSKFVMKEIPVIRGGSF